MIAKDDPMRTRELIAEIKRLAYERADELFIDKPSGRPKKGAGK
jgi:hypothetical protein